MIDAMIDVWKQWEGQVVDGRYALRQFLGASERGPVFLTESGGADRQRCAIKLHIADPETADEQIARWGQAAKLAHPHMLRVLETGRCRLGDARMIYALLEYADEDLGQVVPVRSLTETETREMLRPTLEALAFLHGKGLVHGHVKPSNILAVGEQLKISSDGISPARNPTIARGKATAYDAPEAGTRGVSAAGDVWSMGVTLVEVLTQKLPVWEWKGQEEPQLPRLPAPFGDIAKQCLRRDPQQRCTLAEIAARLDPDAPVLGKQSTAKATAAAVLTPEPAAANAQSMPASKPIAEVPAARGPVAVPKAKTARAPGLTGGRAAAPKRSLTLPAIAIAAAALLAVIFVPKLLHRNAEMSPDLTASAANQPATTGNSSAPEAATPAPTPAPATDSGAAAPNPSNAAPAAENATPAAPPASTTPAASAPAAVPTSAPASEPPRVRKSAATSGAGGAVAHEVLPEVPRSALDTIHGTVRTSVRVEADASGKVTDAEIDSAGPSKYFANLAEKAARDWEFVPPTGGGQPAPSEWVVRFEFSPDGAKATAAPASR
jgi:TonB family protein